MRPGHLGDTTYWFDKNLAGEWFEVEEVYSARPTYHYRDTVRGRTGRETKTKISNTQASLLIPRQTTESGYRLSPYGRKLRIIRLLPIGWPHSIL